jgi:twitching motility protein PilT
MGTLSKRWRTPSSAKNKKKSFEENNELDFSIVIPDVGRFRANYYKTMDDIACAFRIIPVTIPSLDDLNAKRIFKEIIKREKGLILVHRTYRKR